MYFAARTTGHSHLWRQHFPDGAPEQITFGPTEEETVAASPDGRSLLTSLGREQSTMRLHEGGGERVLTTPSLVWLPWLSDDARRLYFLAAKSSRDASDLSRLDVATGNREMLLSGFAVSNYDISHDERQVVFVTKRNGPSELWIGPLDRHEPPHFLTRDADEPVFDRQGRVYFRSLGERENSLHRITPSTGVDERLLDGPILELNTVSPDGTVALVDLPRQERLGGAFAVPLNGGAPRLLAAGWWPSRWSRDGKHLYLEVGAGEDTLRHGRTIALPIGADGMPEPIPRRLPADASVIPHAEGSLAFASDPATYVYVRGETRRNIYRIPLH
jgi:dipeptidyl aminopeptidase/acylaminoacyl peptidase